MLFSAFKLKVVNTVVLSPRRAFSMQILYTDAQFRDIVALNLTPMAVCREDGELLAINQQFLQLLQPQTAVKSLFDVIQVPVIYSPREWLKKLFDGALSDQINQRFIHQDGSQTNIAINLGVLRYDEERIMVLHAKPDT